MQTKQISTPVIRPAAGMPQQDAQLFKVTLDAALPNYLPRPQQDRKVPGLFRKLLAFITPPRNSKQTISSGEIQIELKSVLLMLEQSTHRDDRASASAIRSEMDKIAILQQQLNALLKG
ncbi:hypothetical protein [Parasulfitobacter algicola]|uniref:Uncharacterized protein n=1 Tax=Parasulfitobacter algicola TaxID=2614809 RepID=A0ABX2IX98_9RHOB|nr:hypothetical protein [Sulfitobacter algicola]NSX56771.1 hypothetical protein [Sulfitobacter algicola]